MSFWRYFKGKLLGIGYMFLGVIAMAAGAWLISSFGIGASGEIGKLNIETAGCATGGLIVVVGGLVIAYGQQRLKKMDEN